MGLMALRIVAKQKTPDIQAKCSLWLDLTIALSLHHQAAHLIKTNSFFVNQSFLVTQQNPANKKFGCTLILCPL
jgi:hypothetical protein